MSVRPSVRPFVLADDDLWMKPTQQQQLLLLLLLPSAVA